MKRYKEWLSESFDIRETSYGSNTPTCDNRVIAESFGFIYKTHISFNDNVFSVEFYGEHIPKEMIETDNAISNYKNSVHFSLVENGKDVSDRNKTETINSLYGKIIYLFKVLMDEADYRGEFSIISPLKDAKRDTFYKNRFSSSVLNKILNYFNLKTYSEDEIDLIENGGKAKRYTFKD